MTLPWVGASATGVGSLPGTDSFEAARIVAGELPLPHLHELPARGPGADMVGRALGMLNAVTTDLGGETTPDGWRLTPGSGRQMRRARSWLAEDLDAMESAFAEYGGPLKVQVTGPWTLAAAVELPSGERLLKDAGACRDVAQGLAAAVVEHIADVRRRVPGASLLVQLDEPSLPAVLAGRIGTASGLSSYAPVDAQDARATLRDIVDAIAAAGALAGFHCCAADAPVDLFAEAGAHFVSIDLLLAGTTLDEPIGRAWEAGIGILAGSVPTMPAPTAPTSTGRMSDERASAPVRELASRLGLADPARLASVVVTPSCGLAGASPAWTRTAYAAVRAAARVLRDEQGERGHDDADERQAHG